MAERAAANTRLALRPAPFTVTLPAVARSHLTDQELPQARAREGRSARRWSLPALEGWNLSASCRARRTAVFLAGLSDQLGSHFSFGASPISNSGNLISIQFVFEDSTVQTLRQPIEELHPSIQEHRNSSHPSTSELRLSFR